MDSPPSPRKDSWKVILLPFFPSSLGGFWWNSAVSWLGEMHVLLHVLHRECVFCHRVSLDSVHLLSSFHVTHCHFLQLELSLEARLTGCLGRRAGCDAHRPLVHSEGAVPDWGRPRHLAFLRMPDLPEFQLCPVHDGVCTCLPRVPHAHCSPHQLQMAGPSSPGTSWGRYWEVPDWSFLGKAVVSVEHG